MKKTENQKIIATDIYRYKKNKLAANLALLGLVFNCLYFTLLYGIQSELLGDGTISRFSSIQIGFSVILTLFTLLLTFLSSEGIKGYNKKFSFVLLGVAVFQIIRIFGFPLYGLQKNLLTVNYFWLNPTTSGLEFAIMVIYLCASAACLIASAVIGYIRAVNLEKFVKQVDGGAINVEDTLKQLDKEEEASAAQVAQDSRTAEEVR